MNDKCGYCGSAYEQDRCPNCDHVRGQLPKPFITYGPGYMGDYRTLEQAQALIEHNKKLGPAALYIRVDVARAEIERLREALARFADPDRWRETDDRNSDGWPIKVWAWSTIDLPWETAQRMLDDHE